MPVKPPSYRRQRLRDGHDRAFVEMKGRRYWLGRYGTDESRQRYVQFIAEWQATGGLLADENDKLTIAQLGEAFLEHARAVYRRADRTPTKEAANCEQALQPLREIYGPTDAAAFGPKALKAVRCRMMELGWCRTHINKQVRRIKLMFKWAVANELLPGTAYHGLQAVEGLRAGRSEARESEPVRPVAEEHVYAVLPFLSSPVAAMVRVMMLTGARPGEICAMRACDIDTTAKIWEYRPAAHKTAHHGHQRLILLGPKARNIVEAFIVPDPRAYLFSPAAAMAELRAKRLAARKTPMSCGNTTGSNVQRAPRRQPGQRYTVEAFAKAIYAACDKAFPPPASIGRREKESVRAWVMRLTPEEKQQLQVWCCAHRFHPHQLRHTFATKVRKERGVEVAQVLLGHRTLVPTQVYAERDLDVARHIMADVG